MQQQVREIKYFFYSQAFADGLRATIAILLPSLLGLYSDFFQTGLTISLGCMCVSLTDAPGPIVHKRNGMLFASMFAFLVAIVTGFVRLDVFALGLEIILAAFFFSMFNVYGNRAASVGNSGLLMMILTMDTDLNPGQVLPHALLILAGGIFYTLLSLSLHTIRPYRISQRVLGDSLREIARYLSIKAEFYDPATDLDVNYKKLVAQQIVVHEKQEAVREVLFKSRQIVEETTTDGRRLVYTFTEAVDLFENITATYYDYALLRRQYQNTGALELISHTLRKAVDELNAIGFAIQSNTSFSPQFDYDNELDQLKANIDAIASKEQLHSLVLGKILVNIRDLFQDLKNMLQYFQRDIKTKRTRLDSSKFVSHQSLDPKIFWNNFSLKSSVFRHSLRVCITCMAGFIITKLISYGHHSYWVLLTIIFMLKPAFSLTRQRNIERIIGTFAGGAIGVAILILTPNKTIHFIFLVIFMIGTYSFMRIQYLVMVICTTPYILILFSFLGGAFKVIAEERLLDTVIGCTLSLLAIYFLFPSWEAGQLKKDMRGMVRANAVYFQIIIEALCGYKISILEYKLARKDVYLNSANLSATFQRMLSEPKSKQGREKDIHHFVVLNLILFSNIANISADVIGKEIRTWPGELILLAKKSINKLDECRKKLGDEAPLEKQTLKKDVNAARVITADDLLMKEQLKFIYNISNDLEKNINAIIG